MTIRERRLVCAFGFLAAAKQALYTASQVLGELHYGIDGDFADDILSAVQKVEDIRIALEDVMDMNTSWNLDLSLVMEAEGGAK